MIETTCLLENDDVVEVNELIKKVNDKANKELVDVENNEDGEGTLNTYIDGELFDTYSDVECVVSFLVGLQIGLDKGIAK